MAFRTNYKTACGFCGGPMSGRGKTRQCDGCKRTPEQASADFRAYCERHMARVNAEREAKSDVPAVTV